MTSKIIYVGKDLEAMDLAVNYHNWILKEIRQFIGDIVVEVGAGTGTFSRLLLKANPYKLILLEPSQMFNDLVAGLPQENEKTKITFLNEIFASAAPSIYENERVDTITYINVLEHIEDDDTELRLIYETLIPGGHCLIFVPALMSLYSEHDRNIGHYRRYSRLEIETKLKAAGFEIRKSIYFDVIGVVPWFLKYRIMKSRSLSSSSVAAYDRLVVPIMRHVERMVRPAVGKNLVIVGRKPGSGKQ